ncbi:MAG: zinc ribbon domain-containing protein [Clostridia bacterium]|nr:zinc ribbon domain-containing protein [Clostridia bacterium]
MKKCISCGVLLPDEAGFCGACGTAQPAPAAQEASEPVQQPTSMPPVSQPTSAFVPPAVPVTPVAQDKQPISVGGWMARDLIPCIPIVGGIIYFVMLWIWASDKSKDDTFRNWAKSRLIWIAIAAGVGVLFGILMLFLGFTLGDLISETTMY